MYKFISTSPFNGYHIVPTTTWTILTDSTIIICLVREDKKYHENAKIIYIAEITAHQLNLREMFYVSIVEIITSYNTFDP